MEHRIEMAEGDERRRDHYGVTHESVYVYRVRPDHWPTRIQVWDNTGRPNPHPGETKWNEFGRIGGDGQYLDPRNEGTDEEVTVLFSPESSVISARGDSTGTPASGQVWAPDHEPITTGDVVVLVYPDGREERRTAVLTNSGHGYATKEA